ncbi:glycosyltransferase [Pusillimonas sp. TS35]|nr:glycosyltransferase [Pusillimonas sp. TS35]
MSVLREGRPLRVVHIISGLYVGGAETVLHRLLTAPGQADWNCVISMGGEGVFGPRLREAGITVHTLHMQGAKGMARGIARMHRLLREINPDVVQTWMYHADLIGGIVARAAGVRAVAWGIRNSGADLEKSSRSARWCQTASAPLSGLVPGVIVACAEQARVLHRQAGYRDDRMLVIPNGYDLSRWQPDASARKAVRAEWGVDDDTPVIGSVARWNPLKDHPTLIAAFAHTLRAQPAARCVLIGEGMREDNGDLMTLLERQGVREQVILLGRRDDVPRLMNGLDVHVLSSRAEGFPNVVAEAMATGVLCVVTDVGDAALIVGDTGWVVAPRDPAALGAMIDAALDTLRTAEQADRAARGRARVQARFSLQAMVDGYHVVWQRLARDYPARRPADAGQSYAAWSLADAESAAADAIADVVADGGDAAATGKRLMMVVNNPAFFLSHRLPVAQGAREAGYDVHVATMDGYAVAEIQRLGFTHHAIPMSRSGRNPMQELQTLYALWRLFRAVRPDIVHAVTIKPVLYGGIAARLARVRGFVAAVSGLGFIFMRSVRGVDVLRTAAIALYRLALGHRNSRVIFQNANDRDTLRRLRVVRSEQAVMIRGSGVDLDAFPYTPEPPAPPVVAIMAARLLEDKGVREFVEAARLAAEKAAHDNAGSPTGASEDTEAEKPAGSAPTDGVPAIRWVLAGAPDPGNPASISAVQFNAWQREGVVDCLGERRDIARLYAQSHIVVLPSYREGLPKSLVEAAAVGRAVVTTDVPGCRDAIEPGVSGLLVPARDPRALADAVCALAANAPQRQAMGEAGRRLAEREFDVRHVVRAHLDVYASLGG